MKEILQNLWFRDPNASSLYINDVAVRIRAGLLIFIPIYMGFTLYDVAYTSHWIVDGDTIVDTYETDWDGHIIYSVEAIRRTYEYSLQTALLFYALFEMLAGMSVITSRFSPTILLSTYLARKAPPVWKTLVPKRYAWSFGATMIIICIVFFNPDTFAEGLNAVFRQEILPTDHNYMPKWIPNVLVAICLGFMWMETVLGVCAGCKIHSLLVKLGVLKEECEACNTLDWDEIARKKREKEQQAMR